jgi:eukaryotic-like serine/threonine-protein kinase
VRVVLICPTCKVEYLDGTAVCPEDGGSLVPASAGPASSESESGAHLLMAGTLVGEYEIEKKLGEGGFGEVYLATHPLIGKRAAVKVLGKQYSSDREMMSRFLAEARAVNQIKHRNIVDIFSFGTLADGRQYYVMELLEGTPLSTFLRKRGTLTIEEALPMFRQIARAIDAAHAHAIVHRDLKPENIYLVPDDLGYAEVKILDFGIAKLMGEETKNHKTRTGVAMGTACYMSPEQCHGKHVDYRTDIYAFGCIVYEVLTGHVPFDADSYMAILMKHVTEPAPKASEVNTTLPASIDAPILAMLAKEPNARPTSLVIACDKLAEGAGLAEEGRPPKLRSNVIESVHPAAKVSQRSGAEKETVPSHKIPQLAEKAKRSADSKAKTAAEPIFARAKTAASPSAGAEAPAKQSARVVSSARASRAKYVEEKGGAPYAGLAPKTTSAGAKGFFAIGGAIVLGAAGVYASKTDAFGTAPSVTVQSASVTAVEAGRPVDLVPDATPVVANSQADSGASSDAAVEAQLMGDVNIRFLHAPDSAVVYEGDKMLGRALDGITLPKAMRTATWEIRAEGYISTSRSVDLSHDQTVDVLLLAKQ